MAAGLATVGAAVAADVVLRVTRRIGRAPMCAEYSNSTPSFFAAANAAAKSSNA